MFKRTKKQVPGLNMTATADISFMLLIFFLVATSMYEEKGLQAQLPPPRDQRVEAELHVARRNVAEIVVDADGRTTLDGEAVTADQLTERIATFVANAADDASMPEKSLRDVNLLGTTEVSDRHVVSIQTDRLTSYDAYFRMRHAVARAYARLRNQLAHERFGRSYAACSPEQREALGMVYPVRISEQPPTGNEEKGGTP